MSKQADKAIFSVIKSESPKNTVIWKYPKENFTMGSQLIVNESQEALFFQDGKALDLFEAGRYTLETKNIPILSRLYDNKSITTDTIFSSSIYFINLVTFMGVKWGTDSKIGFFDPSTGIHFQLGACGELNFRVHDSRKLLLKLVGTEKELLKDDLFSMNGITGYFKSFIILKVKSYLASVIKDQDLNVLEIDAKLDILSEGLKDRIAPLLEEYGLQLLQFFVTRIILPEDDPNYRRLKQQYADRYLLIQEEKIRKMEAEAAKERKEIEAETDVQLKLIGIKGNAEGLRIQKQAEAEAYKMQAEAEAEEMSMKGYTYQQETARKVSMEAMKNGIGGENGAVSSIGDIAGLGIGLGALGKVMNITQESLDPVLGNMNLKNNETITIDETWTCSCGRVGLKENFCPSCGKARMNTWDCTCGRQNIIGNFCPNCGRKNE